MSKAPGFRISVTDVIVLVLTGVGAVYLWEYSGLAVGLLLIVVGHFFLFCNVFRVRRKLELIWGALLLINVGCWQQFAELSALSIYLAQAPISLVVLALTLRNERYHGIGWSRINPKLVWPPPNPHLNR